MLVFQPRDTLSPRCSWISHGFLDSLEQDCEHALVVSYPLQTVRSLIFSLLSARARVFHHPAMQAAIPNLVEQGQPTEANSPYQISSSSARIAGPAIAGALVGLLGSVPPVRR